MGAGGAMRGIWNARMFGDATGCWNLTGGKARCIRDEIAAVAAASDAIAQEALALITVEYEELPAVFDPDAALRPGAPLVHEELGSNLVDLRYHFSHGDVDEALARTEAPRPGVQTTAGLAAVRRQIFAGTCG